MLRVRRAKKEKVEGEGILNTKLMDRRMAPESKAVDPMVSPETRWMSPKPKMRQKRNFDRLKGMCLQLGETSSGCWFRASILVAIVARLLGGMGVPWWSMSVSV